MPNRALGLSSDTKASGVWRVRQLRAPVLGPVHIARTGVMRGVGRACLLIMFALSIQSCVC